MKARALPLLTVLLLLVAQILGPVSFATGGGRATDGESAPEALDNSKALQEAIRSGRQVTVIVQLADPPIAAYTGGIPGIGATKPAKGKKFDRNSTNALGYGRFLAERRAAFKAYLRAAAASAVVEAEYDTVVNGLALTLSGRDLAKVISGPGVKGVSIDREFRPLMNVSRGLIGGPSIDTSIAALPGGPLPGQGMKIGIIDTGIEDNHPFFDPSTYSPPPGGLLADNFANLTCCTSNKVIVARAYPKLPGADSAIDTNSHGTHVAGTAAGNSIPGTPPGAIGGFLISAIAGVPISGMSGIAHRAWLGNYNVFPNGQVSARSVEIIRAIEDAVADDMDVLNMSLGGPVIQPEQGDPLAQAVNAAVEAGKVVAVAAGNSGPGLYSVESPGNASGALTAGASSNPHFVGIPVTFGPGPTLLTAVLGQFGDFTPPLTDPLANWNNSAAGAGNSAATRACGPPFGPTVGQPGFDPGAPAVPAGFHTGQIVVIDRGFCTFSAKVLNAQFAGAVGVLIVNNVAGDPIAMAQAAGFPPPTIDAAMVRLADRATLRSAALPAPGAATATVNGTLRSHAVTAAVLTPDGATVNADIIAGFSSRGPVPFDNRLKPDLTAPGVNVLSSINVLTPTARWEFFQGTSMATPHLAGAAALLKQLHPSWTPEQVKSALVTRAKREVFGTTRPLARGGGRVNLDTAKDPNSTFSPPNFSFGQIKPKNKSQAVTRTITLTNISSSPMTWGIAIVPLASCVGLTALVPTVPTASVATFSASASTTGSVPVGGTFAFTVTAISVPNGPQAICTGDVQVSSGGQNHELPWILVHRENLTVPP